MKIFVWSLSVAAFVAFCAWYTNLKGPLTPAEVDEYVQRIEERAAEADPARLARVRAFLEADTGDDLIMLNAILMRDPPLRKDGVGPNETADEVLARYMEFMWPALLQRACHPVLAGAAVAPALDTWGIENAEDWSTAGLMRYRSRRDLMEIATDPDFNGPHEFKIAAMEKTIAFPFEASLQLGDPRLLLGLILFSISAAFHLLFGRRAPADAVTQEKQRSTRVPSFARRS